MTKLERFVYNIVRGNPELKRRVRNLYQVFFDVFPKPKAKSAYPITIRKNYFYGFHDHSPFSHDDSKLLTHKVAFDLRMPLPGEPIEIGFFSGENYHKYQSIGKTVTWNWHMGCKLQWRGLANEVVFNDSIDGKNISRIVDVKSGKERTLTSPIGSVSPDGKWAVGYCFDRVNYCMPGYGYHATKNSPDCKVKKPNDSGIYRIDLNSGEEKLIINIEELASVNPVESMNGMTHFLTHTVISPDSNRFMFLHRWNDPMVDVDKRFSRLVISDFEGVILDVFETDGMASHIGWQDNEHVIAYCRVPKFDDKYVKFKVGDSASTEIIGMGILNSDGHPSYDTSGRWVVTDTYPDRRRVQNLILYDTKAEKRFDIAKLPTPKRFQSPSSYQHWACDLHPRWNRSGTVVCFDSTFSGDRSLCTLEFGSDLRKGDLKTSLEDVSI